MTVAGGIDSDTRSSTLFEPNQAETSTASSRAGFATGGAGGRRGQSPRWSSQLPTPVRVGDDPVRWCGQAPPLPPAR